MTFAEKVADFRGRLDEALAPFIDEHGDVTNLYGYDEVKTDFAYEALDLLDTYDPLENVAQAGQEGECPAGGEHRAVPDSDENDDMRTFSSKTFHCEECGVSLPAHPEEGA